MGKNRRTRNESAVFQCLLLHKISQRARGLLDNTVIISACAVCSRVGRMVDITRCIFLPAVGVACARLCNTGCRQLCYIILVEKFYILYAMRSGTCGELFKVRRVPRARAPQRPHSPTPLRTRRPDEAACTAPPNLRR